jgi:polyisoprenoid-binding protein YceI
VRRLLGLLAVAGLALFPGAGHPTNLRVDPTRSHAEFSVRLLWLHTIHGRFGQITGTVRPDADGTLTVDASIAVQSLQMDSARFRGWVLAPEFFDAAHYPVIHFVSGPVAPATLEQGGSLDGQLTLRGTTRPVHFELLPARCPPGDAAPCLIEARGSVRRSEFGMTGHRGVLSNAVNLGLLITLEHIPR